MTSRAFFLRFLLLTSCCLLPVSAVADGGLFIHTVSSQTTQTEAVNASQLSSDGQRAFFLQRDGGWDLYLQPGKMAVAGAAWVLPVPVELGEEDVAEAPAVLMDQLEFATSPLFEIAIEESLYCPERFVSSGCDVKSGGTSLADGSSGKTVNENGVRPPPAVTRWGEGTVAGWDYVIVDAADAGELVAWLDDNGYAGPDGLLERVKPYVDKGWRFFCGKFSREGDAPDRLPLVRFRLNGLESPVFPMLLTPMSTLSSWRFELFIAAKEGYGPSAGADTEALGEFLDGGVGYLGDPDGDGDYGAVLYAYELYKARLDQILQPVNGGKTRAVVEFYGPLAQEDVEDRLASWTPERDKEEGEREYPGKYEEPIPAEPDVIPGESSDGGDWQDPASGAQEPPLESSPEKWPEELVTITTKKLVVTRLLGRAFEDGAQDITFKPGAGAMASQLARFSGTGFAEQWLDSHDPRCRPGPAPDVNTAGLLLLPGTGGGAEGSDPAPWTGLALLALLFAAVVRGCQAVRRERFSA